MTFLSPKIVFILANSADPDGILHYSEFHSCLHCLPSTCVPVSRMKRVKLLAYNVIINVPSVHAG